MANSYSEITKTDSIIWKKLAHVIAQFNIYEDFSLWLKRHLLMDF